jgi:Calcineurin-like phosphoesterase
VRTLVVSDIHFGAHGATDVLRDPAVRPPLIAALADVDRLVLLGDLLELRHGPLRSALATAESPLREIGAALGEGAEVVIVAGNHDHRLVRDWSERRAATAPPPPLEPETAVDVGPGDPLGRVAELLSPARVRAAYPGVWLRDDVYAIHGHYIDLHLTVPTIERIGAGVMARAVGLDRGGPRRAEDYEAALVPIYAWIDAVAQRADPDRSGLLHGGSVRGWQALTGPRRRGDLRARARALGWPVAVAALNRAGIGPFRAALSGPILRSAGLRAMEQVVSRLGVGAPYVIFGHTHRAGPLPDNEPSEWRTAAGTQLINAGGWVSEPAFLGPDPASSPYRPGFGVLVVDDEAPRLVNVLDAG